MYKWVIREPTAKTCERDSGELSTSASGHPISENVSATTSATSTTEESNISVGAGKFSRKKRKYQEAYLEHGFTYSTIDGEQRPQWLICSEILANYSMKSLKLKTHTATKQAEFKNKPI
jgi:hypothetical protein